MNLFWERRTKHRYATLRCNNNICTKVSVDKWLRRPGDVQSTIKSWLEDNSAVDAHSRPASITKTLYTEQLLRLISGDVNPPLPDVVTLTPSKRPLPTADAVQKGVDANSKRIRVKDTVQSSAVERRSHPNTSSVNAIATTTAQQQRTAPSSVLHHLLPMLPYPNLGNTCFLNSILQFFRAVWNRVDTAIPVDSPCPIFPLLLHPVSDAAFESRIRQLPFWNKLILGRQHDAHEAMQLMLDTEHAMHRQCNPHTCFAHKMKDFCALSFYSHLRCTKAGCSWTSNTTPEFALDLSLAANGANNLLGLYTKVSTLRTSHFTW